MAVLGPLRSPRHEPIPIDARAADHLRYIRETMERAAEFTAVPGWGGVAMGITAVAGAWLAHRQTTSRAWIAVWLAEAFVAVAIAASAAATKAHRANSALFSGPGRKFVLSFAPPIIVGGLLTVAFFLSGNFAALPGAWLLLYGTAIVTGGVFQAYRAADGPVHHAVRSDRAIRAVQLGRCPDGRRFRRGANCFRCLDRPALRRLIRIRMAKSSTAAQERVRRARESAAPLSSVRGHAPETVPADLDRLIHERIRLGIVSALAVNRSLTFNELKALLKTTDGNLSVHARKLEEADYIVCTKSFDGRLPRTEYRLAAAGKRALERYLNHMEALIRATREA